MSKHGAMKLHAGEEAVSFDVLPLLKLVPRHEPRSPIADYFDVANRLKSKIVDTGGDAETFGLLTIGVISAVEFYLRNILSLVPLLCPIAMRHYEMGVVPAGAAGFYSGSGMPIYLSSFDHESLADGSKIKSLCFKFTGIKLDGDTSVSKVIDDFDRLCELRHCLVHSRGFVGLKASNVLGLPERVPRKVLLEKVHVFDVLKIAHNVVRAVNRFLADSIADRWVEQGVIIGEWIDDKERFDSLFRTFCLPGEDSYGGVSYRAYIQYRRASRLRAAALLARVAPATG